MGHRVTTILVIALTFCAPAVPVFAQHSQPLFLEAARDPGRAGLPATARSLALAGVRGDSGQADDALASPASLMLARGIDVVASAGAFLFSRDELVTTPGSLPMWDQTRAAGTRSPTPIGYGGAAFRSERWAAAGFFDASSHYSHEFDTAKGYLEGVNYHGFGYETDGTGHASIEQSIIRTGGAFAVALVGRRLSFGASLYAAHFSSRVQSRLEGSTVVWDSIGGAGKTGAYAEQDEATLIGWGPGYVLSAVVRPVARLSLSARYQREPSFTGTRTLANTSAPIVSSWFPVDYRANVQQPIEFHLPATFAFGGAVDFKRTRIVGEIERAYYSEAFRPVVQAAAAVPAPTGGTYVPYVPCEYLTETGCRGWSFAGHSTLDANSVRLAVEHAVGAAGGDLLLRGGVARDQAYTLARFAQPPSYLTQAHAGWQPPRDDVTWLSVGLGYRHRAAELDGALAVAGGQVRFLADVRVQIR